MGGSRRRGWTRTSAVLCTTRAAIYHRQCGGGTALDSGATGLWDQLALIGAFWLWMRKPASSMMLRTSSTRVSPEGEPTTTPAAK